MNKDLKATLITISMILGFIGFIALIIAFPQHGIWILVGIAGFCGIDIAILLWDSVRTDLDKKDDKDKDEYSPNKAYWDGLQTKVDADNDKKMREARLKKMMENDQKLGLYDFDLDLDENDKNQIG